MYDGMLDNLYPVHYFTFNGKKSTDYSIYLRGGETWKAPERDITSVAIPGRNGELTLDNGRWKNIAIPYTAAWIIDDWGDNWTAFKNHVLQDSGYHKLTDTFHPDYYRMARFTGPIEPEVIRDNAAGGFEINFDCKPQCYLMAGDEWQTLDFGGGTATAWIENPTPFESLPLVEITGAGTLSWNGIKYTIAEHITPLIMDSELMEIYGDGVPTGMAHLVQFVDGWTFPRVRPGNTTQVMATSGMSVRVKTRFFEV